MKKGPEITIVAALNELFGQSKLLLEQCTKFKKLEAEGKSIHPEKIQQALSASDQFLSLVLKYSTQHPQSFNYVIAEYKKTGTNLIVTCRNVSTYLILILRGKFGPVNSIQKIENLKKIIEIPPEKSPYYLDKEVIMLLRDYLFSLLCNEPGLFNDSLKLAKIFFKNTEKAYKPKAHYYKGLSYLSQYNNLINDRDQSVKHKANESLKTAIFHFRQAAEATPPVTEASIFLIHLYMRAGGFDNPNIVLHYSDVFKYASQASSDTMSQFVLACCFMKGQGVGENLPRAQDILSRGREAHSWPHYFLSLSAPELKFSDQERISIVDEAIKKIENDEMLELKNIDQFSFIVKIGLNLILKKYLSMTEQGSVAEKFEEDTRRIATKYLNLLPLNGIGGIAKLTNKLAEKNNLRQVAKEIIDFFHSDKPLTPFQFIPAPPIASVMPEIKTLRNQSNSNVIGLLIKLTKGIVYHKQHYSLIEYLADQEFITSYASLMLEIGSRQQDIETVFPIFHALADLQLHPDEILNSFLIYRELVFLHDNIQNQAIKESHLVAIYKLVSKLGLPNYKSIFQIYALSQLNSTQLKEFYLKKVYTDEKEVSSTDLDKEIKWHKKWSRPSSSPPAHPVDIFINILNKILVMELSASIQSLLLYSVALVYVNLITHQPDKNSLTIIIKQKESLIILSIRLLNLILSSRTKLNQKNINQIITSSFYLLKVAEKSVHESKLHKVVSQLFQEFAIMVEHVEELKQNPQITVSARQLALFNHLKIYFPDCQLEGKLEIKHKSRTLVRHADYSFTFNNRRFIGELDGINHVLISSPRAVIPNPKTRLRNFIYQNILDKQLIVFNDTDVNYPESPFGDINNLKIRLQYFCFILSSFKNYKLVLPHYTFYLSFDAKAQTAETWRSKMDSRLQPLLTYCDYRILSYCDHQTIHSISKCKPKKLYGEFYKKLIEINNFNRYFLINTPVSGSSDSKTVTTQTSSKAVINGS